MRLGQVQRGRAGESPKRLAKQIELGLLRRLIEIDPENLMFLAACDARSSRVSERSTVPLASIEMTVGTALAPTPTRSSGQGRWYRDGRPRSRV